MNVAAGGWPRRPRGEPAWPIAQASTPPSGWFPDGSGQLRWWDGTAWTGYVAPLPLAWHAPGLPRRPPARRLVTGIVLVVLAGLAVAAGALAVMGDPYAIRRVGVAADGDGVVVVQAVCPGERLRGLTLVRNSGSAPSEELWRASGDVALPDRFRLGSAPSGLRTDVVLAATPGMADQLLLRVETSDPGSPYWTGFVLADIPATGVLSSGTVYPSSDAFRRAALAFPPCGTPRWEPPSDRLSVAMLLLAAAAGLLGLGLIVSSGRRPRPSG